MNEKLLEYRERVIFDLRSLYDSYGYRHYKMSRFEEYDLYVRNKDFLVSDQVITFTDRGGRLLALKPDVTLSIIKNAADAPGRVEKLYYDENVYRVDGGTQSFREIMQSGLECVGDLGDYEVAEVVLLAAKSLARISDTFMLTLSHMGLISAILEQTGLSQEGKNRALACLRQKSSHELRLLCREEGVQPGDAELLNLLTDCMATDADIFARLEQLLITPTGKKAMEQLRQLYRILTDAGFAGNIRVDFSGSSDLKYYSGVVFQGYLAGLPQRLLSGGQYDKLLRKMGRKSAAIGFAIYVDLLEQLETGDDSVETLLLHDGTADAATLLAAVEAARKQGSVLVATQEPRDRTWRRLLDMRTEAHNA